MASKQNRFLHFPKPSLPNPLSLHYLPNPNSITPSSPNSPTFSSLNARSYQSSSFGPLDHKPPPTDPHKKGKKNANASAESNATHFLKKKTISLLNPYRAPEAHVPTVSLSHFFLLMPIPCSQLSLHTNFTILHLSISSKPVFFTFEIQNAITYCMITFDLPSKSLSLSLFARRV